MLKAAYAAGADQAQQTFGIEKDEKPSLLRRAAPYLAAATAAGLAYKHMRTPRFSNNPALRKVQELANAKGFHRVVDVTAPHAIESKAPIMERLRHAWQPKADPATGKMDTLNQLKFWAQEGGEAIPVASKDNKQWVANRPGKKPVTVDGVVANRHIDPLDAEQTMAHAVRGGTDLEGSRATQKALTDLGEKGKLFEANLLNRHAPDSVPETWTDLAPHFEGLNTKTPAGRVQAAKQLQERMHAAYGAGGKFMLKPTQGLQSGGAFPWSHDDWSADLARFNKHVATPANRAALREAESLEGGDLAAYLSQHNLLSGHTLHHALKNPASVFGQRAIDKPLGEWRVHSMAGSVPQALIIPRKSGAKDIAKSLPAYTGMGKIKTKDMQEFVERTTAQLPPEYRKGMYGMDIMPHEKPDGSIGYKVIEMNPTERGSHRGTKHNPGGASGFLDATILPYAGHAQYRAATGRHNAPIAGLGALGAAATAGGIAKAVMGNRDTDDEDDNAAPNPRP